MVNNVRLIPYSLPPNPFPSGNARKINGPRFDLAKIQQELTGDIIYSVTDKADKDLENLKWDVDDVAKVIQALLPTDYRDSEWCEGRNGRKFDADAYVIPYDYINEIRKERQVRYYIKFGFLENNLALMLVSCHV
jgi:hypothetical protein